MKKIFKNVILIAIMSFSTVCMAQTKDLNKLITAIATVESTLNEKLVSKDCVGYLQIRPCAVRECNDILKKAKSNKRYSLNDRFDKQKSIEMFYMIQDKFNPSYDIERALCIWNAGPYAKHKPKAYIRKVMKVYENL